MAIDIEISSIAMHAFAYVVRHPAERQNVGGSVERQRVLLIQAFTRHNFFMNWLEAWIVCLKWMLIRHRLRSYRMHVTESQCDQPILHQFKSALLRTKMESIMPNQQEGVMTKRILLAGLVGGIAMFLWSFVAHMLLPLGTAGIKEIPNEQPVLSAMQGAMNQTSGIYLFPAMGIGTNATRQEQNAAMQQYQQKLAANPSGLLIYHPPGEKGLTPARLMTEFLTEIVECLLMAWLLAQMRPSSWGAGLGAVFVIALIGSITTNIPYWNWYGFPLGYTLPYACTQIIAYFIAGLVAIGMLKNAAPQAAAARA